MKYTLAIIIGILLIVFGAFGLYSSYSAQEASTAATSWGAILLGAIALLYGASDRFSLLAKASRNKRTTSSKIEVSSLIRAMGLVAIADKEVREVEIETIANIHKQMLGTSINHAEIRQILTQVGAADEVLSALSGSLEKISPNMRRTIIQSCHLVMISDLEIVRAEEQILYKIGTALGHSPEDVDDIISAVLP